jgi:hypothetical protein
MQAANPLNHGLHKTDSTIATAGQQFDWCIVFPKESLEVTGRGQDVVRSVRESGCHVYLYRSHDQDQVFMLIRAPESVLQVFADRVNFKILLQSDALIEASNAGYTLPGNAGKIAPFEIQFRSDVTPLMPYEQIYTAYKIDPSLAKLYPSPFQRNIRLKLIDMLLLAGIAKGGADLEPRRLIMDKVIAGYYPLHDDEEKKRLSVDWLNYFSMPWNQPIDAVRDYLGEKIALYFTFLGVILNFLNLCFSCIDDQGTTLVG